VLTADGFRGHSHAAAPRMKGAPVTREPRRAKLAAARRGESSRQLMPWPLCGAALIGALFLLVPLLALLVRAPWSGAVTNPVRRGRAQRPCDCPWSARPSRRRSRSSSACHLPGRSRGCGRGASARCARSSPSPGAAASGRRRRVVARARSPRPGRSIPGLMVRHHPAVHDRGCDRRGDVRGNALPHHHRRGSVPVGRPWSGGSSAHARSIATDGVPPGSPCR